MHQNYGKKKGKTIINGIQFLGGMNFLQFPFQIILQSVFNLKMLKKKGNVFNTIKEILLNFLKIVVTLRNHFNISENL